MNLELDIDGNELLDIVEYGNVWDTKEQAEMDLLTTLPLLPNRSWRDEPVVFLIPDGRWAWYGTMERE